MSQTYLSDKSIIFQARPNTYMCRSTTGIFFYELLKPKEIKQAKANPSKQTLDCIVKNGEVSQVTENSIAILVAPFWKQQH